MRKKKMTGPVAEGLITSAPPIQKQGVKRNRRRGQRFVLLWRYKTLDAAIEEAQSSKNSTVDVVLVRSVDDDPIPRERALELTQSDIELVSVSRAAKEFKDGSSELKEAVELAREQKAQAMESTWVRACVALKRSPERAKEVEAEYANREEFPDDFLERYYKES